MERLFQTLFDTIVSLGENGELLTQILTITTIISTIFILFGFGRIIFSIGEHQEKAKTIPVLIFMFTANLFLHGFILFSLYHTIDKLLFLVRSHFQDELCMGLPVESHTFWMIVLFQFLIIFDIIIINKLTLVVDRYLFNDYHHSFGKFWRLLYRNFRNKNKLILGCKTIAQIILGVLTITSVIESKSFDSSIYPILYGCYIILFFATRRYCESIGIKNL